MGHEHSNETTTDKRFLMLGRGKTASFSGIGRRGTSFNSFPRGKMVGQWISKRRREETPVRGEPSAHTTMFHSCGYMRDSVPPKRG